MELLKKWWTVFRRRWPILLICLAIAAVGASAYNATTDKTFTASTELFLRAPDVKTSAGAYQGDLFSRQRAQTYVNMFGSDDLAQSVIDTLGLTETPQQLVSKVSAETVKDTVLMVISVTDPNAQRAANIANGYGDVLNDYVARIENVENNPDIPPLVQIVKRAYAADAVPSGYPVWMLLSASAGVAVVVALGLIWFLEHFDTKVRSRVEVEKATGSTVIGKIPRVRQLIRGVDVEEAYGTSNELKQAALRLSVNIESVLQRTDVHGTPVVAVVSEGSGDGVSVVTRCLARAFESRGRVVALVDSGLDKSPEYAGSPFPRTHFVLPEEPISPEGFDAALDDLRIDSDIVLADSPPFEASIDAQVVVASADAVVLVVRPSTAKKRALAEVIAGIHVLQTPILGVVVTAAKESSTVSGEYL